jgi:glycerol-3-phosphate acyltransferase PlsX
MSGPLTVALDAMGGDNAPREIVAGAVEAAATGDVRVLLCGPEKVLLDELDGELPPGIDIVDAPQVIGCDEDPAFAVRAKPDSSLVQCCRAVREGGAVAAVSAGSTGAMMAASLMHMRRIEGVLRPAIVQPLPCARGVVVLVDCGANPDPRAEHLLQFAYMGSAFSSAILNVRTPSIGLLSIGEESGKGNILTQEAHALLAAADDLDFRGNVEGRDIPRGTTDVVVCDGFTGNVTLKAMEGAAEFLLGEIKKAAHSGLRARIGAGMFRHALQPLRERIDPEGYGGAYLVGLRGLSVIAHGSSSRRAIRNAILHGAHGARNEVVGRLTEQLGRRTPAPAAAAAAEAPAG